MATSDLTILEERANFLSLLRECEKYCLFQNGESNRAFKLLFQIWDKVSEPLFELGYWNDFFQCGKIALKSAQAVNDVAAQSQLLNELGWVCMEWEDFDTAQKYFNESLQKYRLLKDDRGQCKMLRYLGVLSFKQRHFRLALGYYHQALEIVTAQPVAVFTDHKWAFQKPELHNLFGETYLELQDLFTSYRELHLSLEKYHALAKQHQQYRYYLTDPLLNLGRWHFLQGDYEQARQYYQNCLQLSKDINRPDTEAWALLRLAEVAEAEGKEEEALKLASAAESVAGTEIRAVRDRSARFKEKVLTKKQSLNKQ
jgi:tetratricopeptide (TPR) repeat protein